MYTLCPCTASGSHTQGHITFDINVIMANHSQSDEIIDIRRALSPLYSLRFIRQRGDIRHADVLIDDVDDDPVHIVAIQIIHSKPKRAVPAALSFTTSTFALFDAIHSGQ